MKAFLSLLLLVTASLTFAQVKPEADALGSLMFKGSIPAKGTVKDVKECVEGYNFMDITSNKDNKITGTYSYTHAVDNLEVWAGDVTFTFELTFKAGAVAYNFYNFEHITGESEFEPAGILPLNWNAKVGEVFTQTRFNEIKADIQNNMTNIVKSIKTNCAG